MLKGVAGSSSSIATGGAVTGGAAYAVLREDGSQNLAASSALLFGSAAAGHGLQIAAGTAVTDVAALSVTRTNNNAAVVTGVKFTFTATTSAAGFLPFQVLGGVAGTTNLIKTDKDGNTTGSGFRAGSGQDRVDIGFKTGTAISIASDSRLAFGDTTAISSATLDASLSRTAAGEVSVGTGAAGSAAGTMRAAAYKVGSTAGASFGPGVVTSITVVNGIVTAIS